MIGMDGCSGAWLRVQVCGLHHAERLESLRSCPWLSPRRDGTTCSISRPPAGCYETWKVRGASQSQETRTKGVKRKLGPDIPVTVGWSASARGASVITSRRTSR